MGVAGQTRHFRVRRPRRTPPHAPSRARRGRIPGARVSRVTVTHSTAPDQGDIFTGQLLVTFSLDSDTSRDSVCCWSMKISPRNCSVKVSLHEDMGDTHDDPEGSPAGRV